MSTYRDISTLPSDALRSVTQPLDSTDQAQHQQSVGKEADRGRTYGADVAAPAGTMAKSVNGIIANTNARLVEENEKLRQCLFLLMENSELRTMKVLSTVLSMCDDKLSVFMSDKLLEPTREVRTHSDIATSSTQTYKQQATDQMISTGYGKSFDKLSLNDFGNTTFRSSANQSEPTRSHFDTSISRPTQPREDLSTRSSRKQFSPDSAPITSHPPMKFGLGPSPYQKSPRAQSDSGATVNANVRNELSMSVDSHHATGHRTSSKSQSISKEKYVNDNNTEPLRKQMYFTPINVGNEQSEDTGKGHLTYRSPNDDYRSERVSFNTSHSTNLSTDQERTIHENHSARDEHVSVLEKFRKEKEHYETVLAGTMQPDNHRGLAGSNTADDPFTTNCKDTTLVDTDQKGYKYDPQQQSTGQNGSFATVRGETTRQNNREMMGTPVAPSSPVPSSVYRVRERQYNREMMGTPMATSTPVPSPVETVFKQDQQMTSDSLADIMGIKGHGSAEKANFILHRPVDVLTGYSPGISNEASVSLAVSMPNKRIVGEIAFQLDRRILEFVFAGITERKSSKRRSRYYGYSVASIMLLIAYEVRHASEDQDLDRTLGLRLKVILQKLSPFGYKMEHHSVFTQDMVNKYGLLNGAPDPGTVEGFGLNEPAVLRVLLGQVTRNTQDLYDMLIILDCLHYMAHEDGRPLFL